LEDNLSTVCSSAQHSQVAEEDIPHLCKQERKGPTPVRRQLSRTHAVLRRVIPGEWLPVSGMKVRSLAGLYLSNRSTFYRWSSQCAARMLLSVEMMISCCAARTNGCLNAVHLHSMNMSTELSRRPYSMTQRARDSVVPLRRSSACWMPVRM